jgi:hypothetical protein
MNNELCEQEIINELRAETKSSKSIYEWARSHGISEYQVYPILKGRRPMEPSVAAALGYAPVRKWIKQ